MPLVRREPQRNTAATRPPCTRCNGTGQVRNGVGEFSDCWCKIYDILTTLLPDDLACYFGDDCQMPLRNYDPLNKYRDDDMLLEGEWESAAPYIAKAVGDYIFKARFVGGGIRQFHCRVITDKEILDAAFAPHESVKYQENPDRQPGVAELVAPARVNLVVLRLGFLGGANERAPGALYEALRMRQGKAPTWIVIPPDPPFQKGHFAWSKLLEKFLDGKQWGRMGSFDVRPEPELEPSPVPEEPVVDLRRILADECG